MDLLGLVLTATPPATESVPAWWQATSAVRAAFTPSIERAIALGAHADRLGQAFFGGYVSAITALDPSIPRDAIGALCATEDGGGHPRAIRTTLANGQLEGTKHFVSGGTLANVLLVVATTGAHEGHPALKVARLNATAPGVTLTDGPALPFVPEVPHGSATFRAAPASTVLEGDGYARYLKPFRTIEDLHVFGAVLGCLVANGRDRWAPGTTEQLLSLLAAISDLGRREPSSAPVHLALAGLLASAQSAIDALDFTALDPDFAARFERDRPLLRIASKVRAARLEKARTGFRRQPAP